MTKYDNLKKVKEIKHKGFFRERILHREGYNNLEKSFAKAWEERGELLPDLFIKRYAGFKGNRYLTEINQRDAVVVATVIQWLGTNVGFGFLSEVLMEEGFMITRNTNKRRKTLPKKKKLKK